MTKTSPRGLVFFLSSGAMRRRATFFVILKFGVYLPFLAAFRFWYISYTRARKIEI